MEKIEEFACPSCHVKIPVEYMARKTKLIECCGRNFLFCIGCGEEYEEKVLAVMLDKLAQDTAKATGLSPELIKNLRIEQAAIKAEDEANVDEVVDMMDSKKIKKLFRDNRDPHEQAKSPLQIMRERFMAGVRKELQRKIVVPVRGLFQPRGRIILPGGKV